MACLPDDRESAVREVARVYELIKTNQPLLLHQGHLGIQELQVTTQLLLSDALRALNIALSVMKQQEVSGTTAPPLVVKAEPQLSPSSPVNSVANSNGETSTSARRGKRRRPITEGKNLSWTITTTVPYGDGYEWRKYGEKRINGTQFTRNYFRCTHKDDKSCLATKYIQQKDNSDRPVFEVTYNNAHTCNCTTASPPAKKNNPPIRGGASNPPIGHHDVMIKQEATVVPPPLADVSAVPLEEQMPCEEPFPMADHRCVTIGAGDMGLIMTEQLLMGDDPEYQDPDLQALLADLIQGLK